jgi:hypothetical protein
MWHNISTKFYEDWFAYLSNVEVITSTVFSVGITNSSDLWHVPLRRPQMAASLDDRLTDSNNVKCITYHKNFWGYSVGTTVERDFPSASL